MNSPRWKPFCVALMEQKRSKDVEEATRSVYSKLLQARASTPCAHARSPPTLVSASAETRRPGAERHGGRREVRRWEYLLFGL